jgi:putative acetyltransferase
MGDEVSWRVELAVKPGQLDNFRALTGEMVESALGEIGVLSYERFVSENGKVVHVHERYADSASALVHLRTFEKKFGGRFLSMVERTRFTVFGTPSDELRVVLDGFGATYLRPFGDLLGVGIGLQVKSRLQSKGTTKHRRECRNGMSPEEPSSKGFRIVGASTNDDIQTLRSLFQEYAAWLDIDLSFQNFQEELAGLPGEYAPPDGRLLLALSGNDTSGCVALRRFNEHACEMKRMWVRPKFRGRGLGRLLAEKVIAEARKIGYSQMLLDSLPSLGNALGLYRSLGFREIPPYRYNPDPNAVFMQLRLAIGGAR